MLKLLWIWPPPVMKPAAFLKLVKLHVKVAPGVTVALQLVKPNGTKSGLGPSLTVKVAVGGRAVEPAARVTMLPPVPALRVIELPAAVSENVKPPLPPSACLVTTIWPLA